MDLRTNGLESMPMAVYTGIGRRHVSTAHDKCPLFYFVSCLCNIQAICVDGRYLCSPLQYGYAMPMAMAWG